MSLVGRSSEQISLRLPDGLRNTIKEIADRNLRSMNSEIVVALQRHAQETKKGTEAAA